MNDYQNDELEIQPDGGTVTSELQVITLDDFLTVVFEPDRPEYENSHPTPKIGG